ncbi:Uncharacterized protein DAT39_016918 [Clarias magur]|uniref:Uncharacterized protein n=1 Tax=Clarias magur TaxID=1594786 RepID=A0A8J4WWJ4_CLAMG|nr:Uncharacterized protein DAT39_016918 [Clarias magur]
MNDKSLHGVPEASRDNTRRWDGRSMRRERGDASVPVRIHNRRRDQDRPQGSGLLVPACCYFGYAMNIVKMDTNPEGG